MKRSRFSEEQNPFIESFNGRLRDELLNETLFIAKNAISGYCASGKIAYVTVLWNKRRSSKHLNAGNP